MQKLHLGPSHIKRNLVIAMLSVLVIAVLAAGVYYFLKQQDQARRKQEYGSSQTNPDSNTPKANQSGTTGGVSNSKNADDTPATAADVSVTPSTPFGTFVSNHRPNLSGQPAPNVESSTCSTTAGVTCQINFTNGTTTKTLEPKVTNADGNTSWTWQLSDLGLTEGDWKVTAVATNGDKVTTAEDSLPLSVKQ